jgi:hypothetical protein
MFREVAEDLMRRVFDMELKDIQQRIREVYDVDVSDLASGNLLEIFARLHYRRYGEPS